MAGWRKRHHFDRGWGLDIFDSGAGAGAAGAAAMRIVIHCGRSAEAFNRFATMVGPSAFGAAALRQALLDPFDAELLGRLDTPFVCALADNVLATVGDDEGPDVVALLDWLLAQIRAVPKKVPEHLHYRLAETLLFRERSLARASWWRAWRRPKRRRWAPASTLPRAASLKAARVSKRL